MRDMAAPFEPEPVPAPRRLTGRTVLLILLAFFGVVGAVNFYFVSVALKTHTGVVSNEPYRKGLAYNDRIAADEQQHALGWTAEAAMTPAGLVSIVMADKDGKPVSGLTVTAVVGRPATAAEDRALTLKEASPGRYETSSTAFAAGSYVVDARAMSADAKVPLFRLRKRLWLNP